MCEVSLKDSVSLFSVCVEFNPLRVIAPPCMDYKWNNKLFTFLEILGGRTKSKIFAIGDRFSFPKHFLTMTIVPYP